MLLTCSEKEKGDNCPESLHEDTWSEIRRFFGNNAWQQQCRKDNYVFLSVNHWYELIHQLLNRPRELKAFLCFYLSLESYTRRWSRCRKLRPTLYIQVLWSLHIHNQYRSNTGSLFLNNHLKEPLLSVCR